jgi:ectoine hydroxylase-related dioxygenase (phytanoyl-CoA dioxygenase family)
MGALPHIAPTASGTLHICACLVQDCVFLKEPGYAETNWHSDLRMAPLDTNDFVTAWIPLRPVQGGERDSG